MASSKYPTPSSIFLYLDKEKSGVITRDQFRTVSSLLSSFPFPSPPPSLPSWYLPCFLRLSSLSTRCNANGLYLPFGRVCTCVTFLCIPCIFACLSVPASVCMVQSINAMGLQIPPESVEFFWTKLDKNREGRVNQQAFLPLLSRCASTLSYH
jgi:hypothetical protein